MADILSCYFNQNSISMDTFHFLCGEKLGEGESRSVYRYRLNSDYVIKFEHAPAYFSNMAEYDLWSELQRENVPQYKALRKWFAPVLGVSPNGNILIQRYIADIPRSKLPKRVPACFADLHAANWGLYRGQPVCRDYGNHKAYLNGLTTKMIKADWR